MFKICYTNWPCDNISYIYFKCTCNLLTYLKHIILNILNCSMRTDGWTDRQAWRCQQSLFAISRTQLKVQLFVRISCFQPTCNFLISVCPVDTCYRWPPQTAYCLQPRPPLLNCNKSTSLPLGTYNVAPNTCSLNTLQYCSGPCVNIQRMWKALTCN